MNQEHPSDADGAIASIGTPPELLAVQSSLDRLAAYEASRAPSRLEDAIFAASSLHFRKPVRRASMPWLRIAAAIALAAGAILGWMTLRTGPLTGPTAPIAAASEAEELQRQMEAWLSTASWTVTDADDSASSGDVLNDFWPPIEDELYEESL